MTPPLTFQLLTRSCFLCSMASFTVSTAATAPGFNINTGCVGTQAYLDAKRSTLYLFVFNLKLAQSQLGFYSAADESVCVPTLNLQLHCPIAFFKGTLLVFVSHPASLCGVMLTGGTQSCGIKEGDLISSPLTLILLTSL